MPQALRVPIYDSRPHVLYLRSFQTDASTPFKVLASGFTTEEEQLADVLRPLGEMVAIGRPGESLPTPGAARTYATDLLSVIGSVLVLAATIPPKLRHTSRAAR